MADDVRIKIRLVRSPIGTNQRTRQTVRGLGLGKVGSESEVKLSPAVEGMLKRVAYLIEITR